MSQITHRALPPEEPPRGDRVTLLLSPAPGARGVAPGATGRDERGLKRDL